MHENEENKLILTQRNIKYDTVMMQKHTDIMILQKENQSLRDQLKESEIKLAQSNDIVLLLRSESNIMVTINFLRMDLSHLYRNKKELLGKINYLKNEIMSCQSSTINVEDKLQVLLHKNEILKTDIEIIKNSNNQLLYMDDDINKRSLKNTLRILSEKIYKKITYLQIEINKDETKKLCASKQYRNEKTFEIEDKMKQQHSNTEINVCTYKIYIYTYIYIYIYISLKKLYIDSYIHIL